MTTAPDLNVIRPEVREIKLGMMLETLMSQGGASTTRRKVADAAGVTTAALSQYVHGQGKPSFRTLLALAEFFGVSLDFLVYGAAQTSNIDYGPLARYVDHALAGVQARASRHSALVAKLGSLISAELDVVGERLLSQGMSPASYLDDNELLTLERYSIATDLVSMDLTYDLIAVSENDDAAGRFLPVVAANLSQNRTYRFLLPKPVPKMQEWSPLVNRMRATLARMVSGDAVRRNCHFRQARNPVTNGVGIYQLDLQALEAENPVLHLRIAEYVGSGSKLGYVIAPNADDHGDVVMNASHVAVAADAYESLWSSSEVL